MNECHLHMQFWTEKVQNLVHSRKHWNLMEVHLRVCACIWHSTDTHAILSRDWRNPFGVWKCMHMPFNKKNETNIGKKGSWWYVALLVYGWREQDLKQNVQQWSWGARPIKEITERQSTYWGPAAYQQPPLQSHSMIRLCEIHLMMR